MLPDLPSDTIYRVAETAGNGRNCAPVFGSAATGG